MSYPVRKTLHAIDQTGEAGWTDRRLRTHRLSAEGIDTGQVYAWVGHLPLRPLAIPTLFPAIMSLGRWGLPALDKAIWFGILVLMTVGIGLIAPLGCAHDALHVCRGSSASLKPSPSRLKASTSTKIEAPGQIAIQGALST